MYNLSSDGARDLLRYTSLLQAKKQSRDAMSGVADGTNTTFHTQYYPVLTSGSLTVYNASGSIVAVSSTDYDTGEVVLSSAPSFQPRATYTYTPYTTSELKSLLMAGFDEMESRWTRGWYLSSSSSALTAPTDDDTNIYIVKKDQSTGALSDPPCSGSLVFSELRAQVRFYMECCRYAYLSRKQVDAAETGISMREARGAAVDRTQVPRNLMAALEAAEKRLVDAMKKAQDQYYSGGEHLGAGITVEHTLDYDENYDWRS
jgi:hypothetical protein